MKHFLSLKMSQQNIKQKNGRIKKECCLAHASTQGYWINAFFIKCQQDISFFSSIFVYCFKIQKISRGNKQHKISRCFIKEKHKIEIKIQIFQIMQNWITQHAIFKFIVFSVANKRTRWDKPYIYIYKMQLLTFRWTVGFFFIQTKSEFYWIKLAPIYYWFFFCRSETRKIELYRVFFCKFGNKKNAKKVLLMNFLCLRL